MIGITAIGSYVPAGRISNLERAARFETDADFVEGKLGIREVSVAAADERSSDMCVRAFEALREKHPIEPEAVQALIVVTQNPDTRLPHVSSIVHGRLGLRHDCACFDVSLGCSGWVYALTIMKSLLEASGLEAGLIFTSDPYSKIVDPGDKNTAMLFGDAATCTLLTADAVYDIGRWTANTKGSEGHNLAERDGTLTMNGRAVFNFCATEVPKDIRLAAKRNGVALEEIDRFLFHQGSKFIVDTIANRLKLPREKVAFDIETHGNTVSSSIPLLLEKEMGAGGARRILVSGFGVGLSWASNVLFRR